MTRGGHVNATVLHGLDVFSEDWAGGEAFVLIDLYGWNMLECIVQRTALDHTLKFLIAN